MTYSKKASFTTTKAVKTFLKKKKRITNFANILKQKTILGKVA